MTSSPSKAFSGSLHRASPVAVQAATAIASDAAVFSPAFAKRGLIAEHGIAWMLPRVVGPGQAQNLFNSDTDVSTELNLLRQGASEVINGNLLTLPAGGGMLYVQPVYVQSSGDAAYPTLRRVLVGFVRLDDLERRRGAPGARGHDHR